MRLASALLAVTILTACVSDPPPDCAPPQGSDAVYVLEHGWHTELGIPVAALQGGMEFFKTVFPGAKTLMFSYGKKTFFTNRDFTLSKYLLGPVPGPAVIHVVGISVSPPEAYAAEDLTALALPEGGATALSDFIWHDLTLGDNRQPVFVALTHDPAGIFYDAAGDYNLFHTCNSWTVEALQAAGLPLSSEGITFSGQTMSRVNAARQRQCAALSNS